MKALKPIFVLFKYPLFAGNTKSIHQEAQL